MRLGADHHLRTGHHRRTWIIFRLACGQLVFLDKSWTALIGIITVAFLCIVNIVGTKYGGAVQTITTIGKLIPIVCIIVFGLWQGDEYIFSSVTESIASQNFGAAVLATLFAYDGWILLAALGGEMKNPEKVLPKAMTGGILIVTACYLFINLALLHILPADQIVKLGENATSTAATMLFGPLGGKLISIGIIVSIFGCLNGKVLSFPRVIFAMAEKKQLAFLPLDLACSSGIPYALDRSHRPDDYRCHFNDHQQS